MTVLAIVAIVLGVGNAAGLALVVSKRDEFSRLGVEVTALRDDLDHVRGPSAVVDGDEPTHYLAIATVQLDATATQCGPGEARDVIVKVTGEHDHPTGQVHLYDNGHATNASKALTDGEAAFHITFPLRSRHVYSARYGGDSVYEAQPESGTVTMVIS